MVNYGALWHTVYSGRTHVRIQARKTERERERKTNTHVYTCIHARAHARTYAHLLYSISSRAPASVGVWARVGRRR